MSAPSGAREQAFLINLSGNLLKESDNILMYIEKADPELAKYLAQETERQEYGLEMIASENYASRAVMEMQGTILTN